jgi:hypothetical protein
MAIEGLLSNVRFVAATVAVLLAASAAASAQSNPERQAAPAPSAAEQASMQAFGERNKQCTAWTDECRTCLRSGDQVACSNIGIACQPKDIRCTARAAAPSSTPAPAPTPTAPAPAPEKAQ